MEYGDRSQRFKFFRQRLQQLDSEGIQSLLEDMKKQTKQIKRRVYQLCWYMRGGITSDEAWTLSFEDKEIIDSVINENITNTKETGLPLI